MSALLETEADIAVCNFKEDFPDSKDIPIKTASYGKRLYSNQETLRMLVNGESFIRFFVWNKLYKRSVLTDIFFPEGKIFEDCLWTTKVVCNSKSITCMDIPLYHYLHRPDSLSHNNEFYATGILDKIEMYKQRAEYIHEHYPEFEKGAITSLQNLCYHEYVRISLHNPHIDKDGRIRHELHRYFCQSGPFVIQHSDSFKKNLGQWLFRICPWLFWKIYTLRRRLCFNKKR